MSGYGRWSDDLCTNLSFGFKTQSDFDGLEPKPVGQTVLAVDDEPALRDILAIHLEGAGYNVLTASSGDEAIDLLKTQPVDAIVTDIRMRHGNGVKLLEKAKILCPQLPVVFVTGFSDLNHAEALRFGAEDILTKPVNYDVLLGVVARALSDGTHRRRQFTRVTPRDLQIILQDQEHTYHGYVQNVSFGGLFAILRGSDLPKVGSKFSIAARSPHFVGTGQGICRWQRRHGVVSQPRGIGIEFLGLSSDLSRALNDLILNLAPLHNNTV